VTRGNGAGASTYYLVKILLWKWCITACCRWRCCATCRANAINYCCRCWCW